MRLYSIMTGAERKPILLFFQCFQVSPFTAITFTCLLPSQFGQVLLSINFFHHHLLQHVSSILA